MYHWVTDKEFLKRAYGDSANLVNRLVQLLKKDGIEASMNVVGSKKRNMVTQNENEPIDFDFNLCIDNPNDYPDCKRLKEQIRQTFNQVLSSEGIGDCKDSKSVLTTPRISFTTGNKTPFSIDVCIVKLDKEGLHRLIHDKTGIVALDRCFWNLALNSSGLSLREKVLKPKYWPEVRKTYLAKKNMYLKRPENHDHSSMNCYIEAVNEVYAKVFPSAYSKVVAKQGNILMPKLNIKQ